MLLNSLQQALKGKDGGLGLSEFKLFGPLK